MTTLETEIRENTELDLLASWREAAETQPEPGLPNGPAAAAVLAAGIGSALYGLIVLLAEANTAIHDLMIINKDVGPLSGKTTFGMMAWLVVWGALHRVWRNRNVTFARVFTITLALLGAALLLTFPPFFLLFAVD
jgi:hypothetical protein